MTTATQALSEAAPERIWAGYEQDLQNSLESGAKPAWSRLCSDIDILRSGLFTYQTYMRGAFFYRAVERQIGRDDLDLALATFYERFAGQAARMQDMLDVIAEVPASTRRRAPELGSSTACFLPSTRVTGSDDAVENAGRAFTPDRRLHGKATFPMRFSNERASSGFSPR